MKFKLLLPMFIILFGFSACTSTFSNHTVKDTNLLETDKFLDKPEKAVSFIDGKEGNISVEKLDMLYNAFMESSAKIYANLGANTALTQEWVKNSKKHSCKK